MKQIFIFALFFFLSFSSFAQNSNVVKQKELGITLNGFDSYGLIYRFGTNKALWQLNSLVVSGQTSNKDTQVSGEFTDRNEFQVGFDFSREYRKLLASSFELRYGAGLSFNYSYSINKRRRLSSDEQRFIIDDNKSKIYEPGIFLVLGGNYLISEKLVLGAALLPSISYYTTIYKPSYGINSQSGVRYNMNMQNIRLSLVYRFIN